MKVIDRKVGQKAITENGVVTFDLERNLEYRNLYLYSDFKVTLTGGSSDPAYVAGYPEIGIIKKIELVLNGSITLKSLTGIEALQLAKFYEHIVPPISKGAISGAATYNVRGYIPLNFVLPYGRMPIDTILRTKNLAALQLKVTFGAINGDVMAGGDRAFSVAANSNLFVESRESFGLADDARISLNKEYSFQQVITAANQKVLLDIPVGNIIPNIMLYSLDALDPQDDIVTEIELRSGAEVFQKTTWVNLLRRNKIDYELETLPVGFAMLNLNGQDGMLSEAVDARQMSSLKLEITASVGGGTTTLGVVVQEIVPPAA